MEELLNEVGREYGLECEVTVTAYQMADAGASVEEVAAFVASAALAMAADDE